MKENMFYYYLAKIILIHLVLLNMNKNINMNIRNHVQLFTIITWIVIKEL